MPQFLPFHALRYQTSLQLGDVCSPPYDVQNDSDRAKWANQHINNIVHLDLPIGDNAYESAATRLNEWIAAKVLAVDQTSSFTLYRMSFQDQTGATRNTVGVIGLLRIEAPDSSQVRPHEHTTTKAKTDRLELTRATQANLSPIWGLSLTQGLTSALIEPGELIGTFTDENNVTHTIERVNDPRRCRMISDLVGKTTVVIADGHHRYAISRTFRDECPGLIGAQHILCYINELVEPQLNVAAIHRLYSGVEFSVLRATLEKSFEISDLESHSPEIISEMSNSNYLTMISPDGTALRLHPKLDKFLGVRLLDSALLEHALLDLECQVSYQHGYSEVIEQLQTGHFTAGVLIRPVTVSEIKRTADEGLLMPPKSTFFTPKLRTGLVMRLIESQKN